MPEVRPLALAGPALPETPQSRVPGLELRVQAPRAQSRHLARSAAHRKPWIAALCSGQSPQPVRARQVALTLHFVPRPALVWQLFAQQILDWPVAGQGLPRARFPLRSKPDTKRCKPTSTASAAA
jgi:hypothetical protein